MDDDRSSEANQPTLVTDPVQVARIEAENTLRQFDLSMGELEKWLREPGYRLRVSTILTLNRVALKGVSAYAGTYRPGAITITGSSHIPPNADDVAGLLEDFCDYVTENWASKSAIHLSAYALWRLNWIHPFVDGNGRTARAVSYLILCARLGYRLPGTRTIPEQIAANKKPYYAALEQGDEAYAIGRIDVTALEGLLDRQLASQLLRVHEAATGTLDERKAVHDGLSRQDMRAKEPTSRSSVGRILRHVEKHPVIYTGLFTVAAAILAILFQR